MRLHLVHYVEPYIAKTRSTLADLAIADVRNTIPLASLHDPSYEWMLEDLFPLTQANGFTAAAASFVRLHMLASQAHDLFEESEMHDMALMTRSQRAGGVNMFTQSAWHDYTDAIDLPMKVYEWGDFL